MDDAGRKRCCRKFRRSLDAVGEIHGYVEEFLGEQDVSRDDVRTVMLAVEELFTNMVKYGNGSADVEIDLARNEAEIAVRLTDFDVEPFDLTAVPDIRVDQPLEERRPGGLGIHLIKQMMDRVEYEYRDRCSRTTMYKTLGGS